LTGIVRALFWPTEGVVEVRHYDKVWAERTPQPPAELFRFHLSEEGHQRLRRHLRATIAKAEPVTSTDGSTFYPAKGPIIFSTPVTTMQRMRYEKPGCPSLPSGQSAV
jgi:hypothetical protein